jgi:hypothetical protein
MYNYMDESKAEAMYNKITRVNIEIYHANEVDELV